MPATATFAPAAGVTTTSVLTYPSFVNEQPVSRSSPARPSAVTTASAGAVRVPMPSNATFFTVPPAGSTATDDLPETLWPSPSSVTPALSATAPASATSASSVIVSPSCAASAAAASVA